MSDKTLGQVAYEAYGNQIVSEPGTTTATIDTVPYEWPLWPRSVETSKAWEAAAQAVRARVLAEPRIAACLAACDGISTEALEAGGKIRDRMQAIMDAVTEHAAEVLEQDAKMRAALQAAADCYQAAVSDPRILQHNGERLVWFRTAKAMAEKCEAALSGADHDFASTGDIVAQHAEHCCKYHGCKYNRDDCPVVTGAVRQTGLCEECDEDAAECLADDVVADMPQKLICRLMPVPEWTREPPTEPGWWWYQLSPHTLPRAMSVYVSSIHKTLGVLFASGFARTSDLTPGWWQGPISPHGVPPELPKEP